MGFFHISHLAISDLLFVYISMVHISTGREEGGRKELRVLYQHEFGIVISEAMHY